MNGLAFLRLLSTRLPRTATLGRITGPSKNPGNLTLAKRSYATCGHNHGHRHIHQAASAEPEDSDSVALVVAQVAHLLPHQGVLENFVHHNPLHDLEAMPFRDALRYMDDLSSYKSPGERLFLIYKVDPRRRVNAALSDLSATFLDRGAAKWRPPYREKGFLFFFATLEGLGFAKWRRYARNEADRILEAGPGKLDGLAETIVRENLEFFGIPREVSFL
jgi:hypothetical protein